MVALSLSFIRLLISCCCYFIDSTFQASLAMAAFGLLILGVSPLMLISYGHLYCPNQQIDTLILTYCLHIFSYRPFRVVFFGHVHMVSCPNRQVMSQQCQYFCLFYFLTCSIYLSLFASSTLLGHLKILCNFSRYCFLAIPGLGFMGCTPTSLSIGI